MKTPKCRTCLTAKERVILAFQHQETDRVPIYDESRNVAFIETVTGKKMRGSREDLERVTAEAYGKVGIDMIRSLMTPRWGIEKGEHFEIKWDGYCYWKIGGDEALTLEESREYLKRTAKELSGQDFREQARATIREAERLQAVLGENTLFVPSAPVSCLECLYHTCGIENFSIIMYEASELIDEVLELNMEHAVQCIEVFNNIYDGPIIHCGDDFGIKGTTLFSPQWLREHVFPRMKTAARKIRDGNKYFLFHTCGNVTLIVPDLIELGVDALEPFDISSGMNLADMKRSYGDKLVLLGNADGNIIGQGSPDSVRAEVRRCLEDAAAGGGYFLNGVIPQTTPAENLLAYFDEAKRYTGWRSRPVAGVT